MDKKGFEDLVASIAGETAAELGSIIRPREDETVFEVQCRSDATEDVREALVGFWLALAQVTEYVGDDTWDVVVCDVGDAEEGTITGWAAKLALPFRIPEHPDEGEPEHLLLVPGAVALAHLPQCDPCEALELDEDDPGYDEAVEEILEGDETERVQRLLDAASDPRVTTVKERWMSRRGFGAFWVNHAGVAHESKFELLFGAPLPKPPQPKTALGVFARLFQATENGVYRSNTCFTWDGDELVAVKLSGRSVDDAVIALLDDVDDVAKVCRGLQRIELESTRVTPQGLEKLKALFPQQQRGSPRVVPIE